MLYNHISNPKTPLVSTEGASQDTFQTENRDTLPLGLDFCVTHICSAKRKLQDLAQVLSPLGSFHRPTRPGLVLPWESPPGHQALRPVCRWFTHPLLPSEPEAPCGQGLCLNHLCVPAVQHDAWHVEALTDIPCEFMNVTTHRKTQNHCSK